MKRSLALALILLLLSALLLAGCNEVWGKDKTSELPDYYYLDGEMVCFTLELRQHGSKNEAESGDKYSHSNLDGELIYSWQIPYYGNTVYEAVQRFFENRQDNISFVLSQHRYYIFDTATLEDGSSYSLSTAYVAADGAYSSCANFQSLFGKDEVFGTLDDLRTLVVVYEGWL